MAVCDANLIHTSHISDEEDLRFRKHSGAARFSGTGRFREHGDAGRRGEAAHRLKPLEAA